MSFGHQRQDVSANLDTLYNADDNGSLPFLAVHEAAKAWYSLKGYHAMPTYLNVLNNAILRANLPNGSSETEYGEWTELLSTQRQN